MTYDNKRFLISELSNMDLEMGCALGFNLNECNEMSYIQLQQEYRDTKEIYSFIMSCREKYKGE